MKRFDISRFGVMIVILFFITFSFILIEPISSLDELWNYSFSKNIANGLLPYVDFNIVQTPLVFFITALFLKFGFNGLITTRILATILSVLILIMVYIILNKLIKNKYANLFIMFNVCIVLIPFFCLDYNFLVLLFALILLNYELKSDNDKLLKLNVKSDFILGIVAGLAIITKQSTGLIIAVVYVFYKWLAVRKKEDFVVAFKISLSRGLGVLVPVILFFTYLIVTKSFVEFWNYCLFGVSEFKNSISYIELLKAGQYAISVKILAVMVLIVILYAFIYLIKNYKLKTLESRNILKLFVYGVASFVVIYPISDDVHFLAGFVILLLLSIYIVATHCKLKNEKLKLNLSKLVIYLDYAILAMLVVVMCANYYHYIMNDEKNHNLEHYEGIPINENIVWAVNRVNEYIEEEKLNGRNVYILNADAVLYNITKDRYNKYFDLPLKGNLGKNGIENMINEIKGLDSNSVILILQEGRPLNWQMPKEIIAYIRENYELVGKIVSYDMYSIN